MIEWNKYTISLIKNYDENSIINFIFESFKDNNLLFEPKSSKNLCTQLYFDILNNYDVQNKSLVCYDNEKKKIVGILIA